MLIARESEGSERKENRNGEKREAGEEGGNEERKRDLELRGKPLSHVLSRIVDFNFRSMDNVIEDN